MAKQVQKSRVFAVVLAIGDQLGAYFLCAKTVTDEAGKKERFLDVEAYKSPWRPDHKDAMIQLLKTAGLTVRFYDPEEQRWMDHSAVHGLVGAPGPRDGTWGPPSTLEEFEENYLKTV